MSKKKVKKKELLAMIDALEKENLDLRKKLVESIDLNMFRIQSQLSLYSQPSISNDHMNATCVKPIPHHKADEDLAEKTRSNMKGTIK